MDGHGRQEPGELAGAEQPRRACWQRTANRRPPSSTTKTAARLQPSAAKTYLNIANLAQAAGKLDEAAKWYAVALRFEPTYAMAHYNLGVLLAHQGKIEEAISEYTEACVSRPTSWMRTTVWVPRTKQRGGWIAPSRRMKPPCSCAPILPKRITTWHGIICTGELEEAIRQYETALRLRPDFPESMSISATCCGHKASAPKAIAHYEAALQLQPTHAEAHNSLAVALAEQGQLDEAIAHLQQAVRAKPEFAEPHNNLGNALQSRGDLAGAIAQYEAALQLRPTYAEAQNNLGMALTAEGKTDAALTQFEQAVQSNPICCRHATTSRTRCLPRVGTTRPSRNMKHCCVHNQAIRRFCVSCRRRAVRCSDSARRRRRARAANSG